MTEKSVYNLLELLTDVENPWWPVEHRPDTMAGKLLRNRNIAGSREGIYCGTNRFERNPWATRPNANFERFRSCVD